MRHPLNLILATLLLAACGGQPDSPEAALRALLARAEQAAEARNAEALAGLLAEDYRDRAGRGPAEIERLLRLYFLRHREIHLLTDIETIELPYRDFARATVVVGMAGDDGALLPRTGVWRFELEFNLVEGEWRVSRAEWARARGTELL